MSNTSETGWGVKTEGTTKLFSQLKDGSVVKLTYLDTFEYPEPDESLESDIGKEAIVTSIGESDYMDDDMRPILICWLELEGRVLVLYDNTDEIELVSL